MGTTTSRIVTYSFRTCHPQRVGKDGCIHSALELRAEVLSPANAPQMMTRKKEDYAGIGVPELWILSPENSTFEVLHLEKGKLGTRQILKEGYLHPLCFPNVQVGVASVWPD